MLLLGNAYKNFLMKIAIKRIRSQELRFVNMFVNATQSLNKLKMDEINDSLI